MGDLSLYVLISDYICSIYTAKPTLGYETANLWVLEVICRIESPECLAGLEPVFGLSRVTPTVWQDARNRPADGVQSGI